MAPTTVSDPNLEDTEVPYWDTTPLRMRGWYRKLPEYLEDLNPDYPLWWSQGAVMSRK